MDVLKTGIPFIGNNFHLQLSYRKKEKNLNEKLLMPVQVLVVFLLH